MEPDIRYAYNGDVAIAYAVFGDGPTTLVMLSPWGNLEVVWENPLYAHYLRRLAAITQVVLVDRRGTGLSDRFSERMPPPLEVLVDDVTAVLDDVECERAVLYGFAEGAALCAMFAGSRPERVSALILYAATACGLWKDEYPWQWTEDEWAPYLDRVARGWGTPQWAQESLALFAPSHIGDGRIERWWLRFQRLSASPAATLALEQQLRQTDIRSILGTIGVPTLVLHRTGDQIEPVGQGRYIADAIPSATYRELPGNDNYPWAGDSDAIVDEIARFLEVEHRDHAVSERVLATVLFTDIVDSTQRAAALGDAAWTSLLLRQREYAMAELERFRGVLVDTAGDGMLATFDGPARAVQCAKSVLISAQRLGLQVRAGCHTGEIETHGHGVAGMAVHIAARISARASAGEVLTSSTVKDLTIGSGLTFDDAGVHSLKGVPDEWHLYRVAG